MWAVYTTDRAKVALGDKTDLTPLEENCCIDCMQVHDLLSSAKAVVFRKGEDEIVAWYSKYFVELWVDVRGLRHKTDAGHLEYMVWNDTFEGLTCLAAMLGLPRESWNCIEVIKEDEEGE